MKKETTGDFEFRFVCDDLTVVSGDFAFDIAGDVDDEAINQHEPSIKPSASRAKKPQVNLLTGIRPSSGKDEMQSGLAADSDYLRDFKNIDVSRYFTRPKPFVSKSTSVVGVNIPDGLRKLCLALDKALGNISELQSQGESHLQVDQVEVSLTVDTEGKLAILSAGASAGFKVIMKRKQ